MKKWQRVALAAPYPPLPLSAWPPPASRRTRDRRPPSRRPPN